MRDPGEDAMTHPGTQWPTRGPKASMPSPPADRWRAWVPSGDRPRRGQDAGGDLLAEDRDLRGRVDAQSHLGPIQFRHRDCDPIADQDLLAELAGQDQHGGLLSW